MALSKIVKQIIFWLFCFILIFKADWLLNLVSGPLHLWWIVFIFLTIIVYIALLLTKKM